MSDVATLSRRLNDESVLPAQLGVAAYLGHAAAAQALGAQCPPLLDPEVDADAWISGWLPWVEPVYNQALTRLHVATARSLLYLWERVFPDDRRPHAAIEAGEGWLRNPTDDVAWEARKTVEPLMELIGPIAIGGDKLLELMTRGPEPQRSLFAKTATSGAMATVALAAGAASHPAIAVKKLLRGEIPREAGFGIGLAVTCFPPKPTYDTLWRTCLEAARRDMLPWALGERDPV